MDEWFVWSRLGFLMNLPPRVLGLGIFDWRSVRRCCQRTNGMGEWYDCRFVRSLVRESALQGASYDLCLIIVAPEGPLVAHLREQDPRSVWQGVRMVRRSVAWLADVADNVCEERR